MLRIIQWITLAIRALRGYRTYDADPNCGCPECLGTAKVPFRYRFNQPPFRSSDPWEYEIELPAELLERFRVGELPAADVTPHPDFTISQTAGTWGTGD